MAKLSTQCPGRMALAALSRSSTRRDGGHGLQGGEAGHQTRERPNTRIPGHHPPLLGLNPLNDWSIQGFADPGDEEELHSPETGE